MTVESEVADVSYAGDGVTVAFAIPFAFLSNADIEVAIRDSDGDSAVITTGFTITGAGAASGTCTFTTAPASGVDVVISRAPEIVQPVEYTENDSFPAASHETGLDRRTMVEQYLRVLLDRSIRLPAGDESIGAGAILPAVTSRAGKLLYFDDTTGAPDVLALADVGGTVTALTSGLIGTTLDSLVRTAAEISAGVTPTNYAYHPLHIKRYGAVVDGSTNDYAAINSAVLVANQQGGGTVRGWDGGTAKCNSEVVVLDDVIIDMEGGKTAFALSGENECGYHMRSRSQLLNGEVTVTSSGSPGSQSAIHSGIFLGNLYSAGGTVASPAAGSTVTGAVIRNIKSSTDKSSGGAGVVIYGDVSNCLIENFEVPDSATMLYGIAIDWAYLGTLTSSTDAGVVAGRTAFDAGTMITTHPTQITMRNVKVGSLTAASASHGIRLSGCDNIIVENFKVAKTTYAALFHTAGDVGYEFAPAAVKVRAHKNIQINGFDVVDASTGWGAFVDCYADNVASAVTNLAYSPLLPTIARIGIAVRQLRTQSASGASALPGIRVQNCIGGVYEDCEATLHTNGFLMDTGADRVVILRGRYHANRNDGILIHHGTDGPEYCTVDGAHCFGNATATSTESGIYANECTRVAIRNCQVGEASEATQLYGVRASTDCVDLTVEDNDCAGLKAAGVAYNMGGSSTAYGVLFKFAGNRSSAPSHYTGADIVPFSREMGLDGVIRGHFRATRSVLSSDRTPNAAFAGKVGDRILYSDPVANGFEGTTCVTAGSPGTWKIMGFTEV